MNVLYSYLLAKVWFIIVKNHMLSVVFYSFTDVSIPFSNKLCIHIKMGMW